MAKIYRQSGSLTQLIDELEREKTGKFRTIDEIRSFYDNCKNSHNRILKKHAGILRTELVDLECKYKKLSLQLDRQIKERETLLRNELKELKATLAGNEKRNVLTRLFFFFWKKILTRRKAILDNSFEKESRKPFRKGFKKIESVRSEIEDRKTNAEKNPLLNKSQAESGISIRENPVRESNRPLRWKSKAGIQSKGCKVSCRKLALQDCMNSAPRPALLSRFPGIGTVPMSRGV